MNIWKIAYTIQDGEHEYGDYFTCELEPDTLEEAMVAALVADHWGLLAEYDPEERQQFLQDLVAESYAFLPGDTRAIKELGWERVSPIIVTVREGLVVSVTGLSDGVSLEVQDWDNGELDEEGKPVPTVRVWE